MRLKNLEFSHYKNLKDVKLDFTDANGVVVIAGCNGAGKSNLLEAIVSIFSELAGHASTANAIDNYKVTVVIDRHEYVVVKTCAALTCSLDGQICSLQSKYLPRQIVSVYSGHVSRLRQMMCVDDSRFVHLDFSSISAAILLLLSSDRADIRQFCQQKLHYNGDVRICIKFSRRRLYSRLISAEVKTFWQSVLPSSGNRFKMGEEEILDLIRNAGSERALFNRLRNDFKVGQQGFIQNIEIKYKSNFGRQLDVNQLSEGELKQAFFHALYEFVAEEDSLLLLDEPDTHIHETRKVELLELFKHYAKLGRQTVFTTHSPGLINNIDEHSLVSEIKDAHDRVVVELNAERTVLLKDIAGGRMSVYSNKPIVLFEGKSDVYYLIRALEFFKKKDVLNGLEFLTYGGAGDVEFVYNKFREVFPDRQIRVYCDRDSGGLDVMRIMAKHFNLINTSSEQKWNCCGDIPSELLTKLAEKGILFIPQPFDEVNEYAVEDYLSGEFVFGDLEKNVKQKTHVGIKLLSGLCDGLKRRFYAHEVRIPDEEKQRFAPLVVSVEDFYRKCVRYDMANLSILIPIFQELEDEYLNAQIKSLNKAQSACSDFRCELIILDAGINGNREKICKYDELQGVAVKRIDVNGMELGDALIKGVQNACGDYFIVLWQHATIREKSLKSIKAGRRCLPDCMLFEQDEKSGIYSRLTAWGTKNVFPCLNKATALESLCISREFFFDSSFDTSAEMFSDRIGLRVFISAKNIYVQGRSMSRWRKDDSLPPKINATGTQDQSIQQEIKRLFQDGGCVFFA